MRWAIAAIAAAGASAAVIVATSSTAAAEEPADVTTALADPTKLPLRVHVATLGPYGLTADATDEKKRERSSVTFDDVPLVEARPGRVRIVRDEDGARMLLWIDEVDLAWGIAKKTRIAGKGDVGIWLLPGARVIATGKGARRRVKTRFNVGLDIELSGVVPADALTRTFTQALPPDGAAREHHASAIRLEPGGRKLPGFTDGLPVHVVSSGRAGWTLVEHRSRWLEVRGWVRDRDLGGDRIMRGSGGGVGYGMSHTDRVDVNAGACLYAAKDGPITGVTLAPRTRYTPSNDGTWWTLYVGMSWGNTTVLARAASVDKGKPTFAPCPTP